MTQYSIDGKKIKTYASGTEAALRTGVDSNTISKCALRKSRLGGGYVWRYASESYTGEVHGKIKNLARPILQFTLDGKFVKRFESVSSASTETTFSSSTLLACARKEAKVSHGYVWRFEGDRYKGEYSDYRVGKPVTQFTLTNRKVKTYPTIEAARESGLTAANIQKNVSGKNKTAGGFVWRVATNKETIGLSSPPQSKNQDFFSGRKIVQYSVDGKKVGEFNSVTIAARVSDMPTYSIYHALDKPKRVSGGFVWRSKGNRYNRTLS